MKLLMLKRFWFSIQVIERVVEEISFHAPERTGETFTIDKEVSEPKLEACLVNYRLWNAMCKGIVTQ
jgi:ATP-dependent protease HslVU (ClpYQ) ATPase subunit